MAWLQFVHDAELGKSADTVQRRRDLVIALPKDQKTFTPIGKLRRLTTDLALQYVGKTPKTVTRDVNTLVQAGLLVRNGQSVRPRIEAMLSLLALRGAP
jgi:hypothetical protein